MCNWLTDTAESAQEREAGGDGGGDGQTKPSGGPRHWPILTPVLTRVGSVPLLWERSGSLDTSHLHSCLVMNCQFVDCEWIGRVSALERKLRYATSYVIYAIRRVELLFVSRRIK